MIERYTSPTALRVYQKMCNFHREVNRNHKCRNSAACVRVGRLASWLEGLTEEDVEWVRNMRNYYATHSGEPWSDVRIALDLSIRGVRRMV